VYNEEAEVVAKVIDEIIHAGFRKLVIISDGSPVIQTLLDKQKQYNDKMIILLAHTINR
jgi:hypothetical protein